MSYDIELCHPTTKEVLSLDAPHHMAGGTYQLGGTTDAHLNITYNYGCQFHKVLGPEGIRSIYGLTGAESIPILRSAILLLADDITGNYWEPTEGNAKQSLLQLLALAQMRPDGIWQGD